MQVNRSATGPVLLPAALPQPEAAAGEVLINVRAAGVTPTELIWYPTTHNKDGSDRRNAVPGHEFSGIIAALGTGVEGFRVGDEVYGMNDWFADGATGEYCLTVPAFIALKPKSLSHELAATVPIGALTAWQGIFERAKLQPGERVLIHGAAGAVGIFAVQLARQQGAQVIATASGRDADFVTQLGASLVIDYRSSRFEEIARDIDVVFDAVGGETLARSWQVLKPGGRLVTIAASSESASDPRVKDAFFIVEPNHEQLAEVAGQLDAGRLKTFLGGVLPLERASEAYDRSIITASITAEDHGKVVVALAS
jgi:NADPH:quinone reductase-like Zn-dependent oxidoreductase